MCTCVCKCTSHSVCIQPRGHSFLLDLDHSLIPYSKRENPIDFSRSRSKNGNGQKHCIQPRGHIFNQILTTPHTHISNGKTKNTIDIQGQRSRSQIGNGQSPCIQLRGHIICRNLTRLITYSKTKNPIDFLGQSSRSQI